jgi:hypothetical protein
VPAYYLNWAAIDLPDVPFVDRTTHVIDLAHPDHPDMTLVVCRERFPAGKTLRELAARRVAEEMTRLVGYSVIENGDAAWASVPAIEVTSRWRHEDRLIYQRQAHLAADDAWVNISLSCPIESRAACDEWFSQIASSLRLRTDD